MGRMVYLKGASTLVLDDGLCSGCGMCVQVCPHAVLSMDGGLAGIRDLDACMECGACGRNCPEGAISVQAGVGCAQAVLNTLTGRQGCCTLEPARPPRDPAAEASSDPG